MTLHLPLASVGATDALAALRRASVEEVLLPVLVQLALIIVVARLFAALARRLGQPSVVGEIAAGLVLGPSVLGRLLPGVFQAVFQPGIEGVPDAAAAVALHWVFSILSQLGLVFLLFLVGLEFDFSHLRWQGPAALGISLAGIALPFGLGLGLAVFLRPEVAPTVPALGFGLFLGTALSITAIPVLGRILMELGITRTRLGALTITAAAVDDAAGWILLATVAAVVGAQLDLWRTAGMAAATGAFAVVLLLLGRPLRWAARRALRAGDGDLGADGLAGLVAVLFTCAVVTNRIGVFAVFGAFLLGAVLSPEHDFRVAVNRRLRDFVTAFFVPLFFAYTGLRTDMGSLGSSRLWLLCGLVSAVAVVGKVVGCGLAARLGGHAWREVGCIGVLMNTRGLMALVAINLGKDLGVVPDSLFCMLVVMALLTTVMTTPLLLLLMHGTELEPYILRSGFLGQAVHPPAGARVEVKEEV